MPAFLSVYDCGLFADTLVMGLVRGVTPLCHARGFILRVKLNNLTMNCRKVGDI